MSDDYTPPTPTQVETVVGALDDGTEIATIMRAFYPLLLERAWERAGEQVQLGTAFDLRNPRVQETIAGLAQKVRRVADTTRDDVRRVMALVDADGISYNQAAQLLRGVTETLPDGTTVRPFDAPYRAFMIAVTESAYAYSRGQVLAWQESGEVDRMQWVAETNACAICTALNGQIVTLGGPFGSGREVPAHPNCRCTLSPVLKDEFSMPEAPASGPPKPLPTRGQFLPDGSYVPSERAQRMLDNIRGMSPINIRLAEVEVDRLKSDIKSIKVDLQRLESRMATEDYETYYSADEREQDRRMLEYLQQEAASYERARKIVAASRKKNANDVWSMLEVSEDSPVGSKQRRPGFDAFGLQGRGGQFVRDPDELAQRIIESDLTKETLKTVEQRLSRLLPARSAAGVELNLGLDKVSSIRPPRVAGDGRTKAGQYFFAGSRDRRQTWASSIDGVFIPEYDNGNDTMLMHQVLHMVQSQNLPMRQRIQAYLDRRSANKPVVNVGTLNSAYDRVHRGANNVRDGGFWDGLVGATYVAPTRETAGQDYELVPMFAQMMTAGPGFIDRDPETFMFLVDLLSDPTSYQAGERDTSSSSPLEFVRVRDPETGEMTTVAGGR
jgi:SPP1 gp7 family putative phage head morphogenesis protein